MKSINGLNKKYFFVGAIILSMVLFFTMYYSTVLNANTIHKGISVGTIDISGLTKDKAIEKVKNSLTNFDTVYLTLKSGDKKWQIPYSQINAKFNVEQVVDRAYAIGRTGNIFNRIKDIISVRLGKKFDVIFDYNKDLLYNNLESISKEIDVPKKNAKIVPSTNGGAIAPSIVGTKLDLQNAFGLANDHISKLKNEEIELPIAQDLPTINEKELKNMTTELSSFSTNFNTGDVSRTNNIKLACSRIDGTILQPNEIFSMDKTILNRTYENGYKLAKAFFENQIVDEVGGGVCQVTTTLYDAVLTANLDVTERQQHSMMVDYVSPGFDAAVSDKGVDLKFRNSLGFPVYLYSAVKGSKIEMRVYGQKAEPGQRIQLESEITEIYYPGPEEIRLDSSLPSGVKKVEQKSKNGYKATLYKVVYKDGAIVSRQPVSQNIYRALRGKIKIGR